MRLALGDEAVENVPHRNQLAPLWRDQSSGHPVAGREKAVLGQNLSARCRRCRLPFDLQVGEGLDERDEGPDVPQR